MRAVPLIMAALAGVAYAQTADCSTGTPTKDATTDNYFCGAVNKVVYQNFVSSGSYQDVTGMSEGGQCSTQPHQFNEPLGPLSEELSVHIRGPFHLKQFAWYAADGGTYHRNSYYNSQTHESDNLVFTGYYGGSGSGVFDEMYGSSLAYVDSQGTAGASSSQVLNDVVIPDSSAINHEVVLFTNQKCTEDICGFSRAQDVAYKGFTGSQKVLVFEFSMPHQGDSSKPLGDQPALWLLNGKIPRTQQYGDCSCWPACGEIDLFEILIPGDERCKSTIHEVDKDSGGSSDYFQRPTNRFVKAAAVLDGPSDSLSITLIDDGTEFGQTLDSGLVQSWAGSDDASVFQISLKG